LKRQENNISTNLMITTVRGDLFFFVGLSKQISLYTRASAENFSRKRATEKKTEKYQKKTKIALLSLFQGGGATEKDRKTAKKTEKYHV